MQIPDNLLYTKEHEWARVNAESAVIGITDFAQHALGDITFIDLPKPGAALKQFEYYATVESVKAASDVYAPLSGEVVKVNSQLVSQPELANKSPYESGWFAEIKISAVGQKDKLMSPQQYAEYVQGLSK